MADDVDIAQEINEQFQTAALARRPVGAGFKPALPECADCGEDIPEARRRAMPGCERCIDCQTLHEQRGG